MIVINFSFDLALSSKKDSDLQPVKGGTVHDLDDDGDKNEDSQMGKASDTQVGVFSLNYFVLLISSYTMYSHRLIFSLF